MEFPHKCSRCGFCCISENCPVSQRYFNIPKYGVVCPALSFNNNQVAICKLVGVYSEHFMGIGAGCCIKATLMKGGKSYDFAALDPEVKRVVVSIRRERA